VEENLKKKVDETWKEQAKTESETVTASEEPIKIPEGDFKFFATTLGMQAWIALGIIPNPMTKKAEENFNQAKFIIDTLDMLKEKTKGNLDKEETGLVDDMLYELRLAYVQKTTEKGQKEVKP
jgi:hypothetical protein